VLDALDLLPQRFFPWLNESVAPNERRRPAFSPGTSREFFFGGSERRWSRSFQYPESERVRYSSRVRLGSRGARIFRCNFVVVLVIGSEMGLGRPASAAPRPSDADWREVPCDKFGTCRTNNCQRSR